MAFSQYKHNFNTDFIFNPVFPNMGHFIVKGDNSKMNSVLCQMEKMCYFEVGKMRHMLYAISKRAHV